MTETEAEIRSGVDGWFAATLRFADGTTAAVRSSMVADRPIAQLSIVGDAGAIEIDNPLAPHRGHVLRIMSTSRTTDEVVPGPTTYEAQLRAVRATLIESKRFALPIDDAVCSMAAIDAVRAAF